jgi:hypothetical protein
MSTERIFGFTSVALVLVALVLAFLYLGTPGKARLITLDERRVEDLQSIAMQLNNRYGYENAALPARLPEDLAKNDPGTTQPYEFHRVTARVYELCAVFALPSAAEDEDAGNHLTGVPNLRRHGAGRTCYKINDTSRSMQPIPLLQE